MYVHVRAHTDADAQPTQEPLAVITLTGFSGQAKEKILQDARTLGAVVKNGWDRY
jgi:hypothetical protein